MLQAQDRQVTGDVPGLDAEVGNTGVADLLEVGLELLGGLGLELDGREAGRQDDLRTEGLGDRLVEERLTVAGGQHRRLHLHAVLGESLHDRDVGVGDEREVDGIGAGVLDAEHLRADVGAAEVDRGVGVDGLHSGDRRDGELLEVLRRGGRRRRGAVAEHRGLRRAHRLHELRYPVVTDTVGGDDVPQGRDDVLVPGFAVVRAVVPAVDLRHLGVLEVLVRVEERGEGGIVHDHEHVLVLHQVLRGRLVDRRRLVVDHVHLDLPLVDATRGVLAVDAGLATLVGVLERGSGDAGLREDVADLDAVRGDAVVERGSRTCAAAEARRRQRTDRGDDYPQRQQSRSHVTHREPP